MLLIETRSVELELKCLFWSIFSSNFAVKKVVRFRSVKFSSSGVISESEGKVQSKRELSLACKCAQTDFTHSISTQPVELEVNGEIG